MLSAVHVPAAKDGKPQIEYKVASAEDLSFIESNSVDMVTAGQAAHWFKQDKAFPEIARILKPGGTLAFFCILHYRATNAHYRLWRCIVRKPPRINSSSSPLYVRT